MSLVATCSCGMRYAAKPELAGRVVACPRCGQAFRVPLPGERAEPALSPAPSQAVRAAAHPQRPSADSKRQSTNPFLWVGVGASVVAVLFLIGGVFVVVSNGKSPDPVAEKDASSDTVGSAAFAGSPRTGRKRRRRARVPSGAAESRSPAVQEADDGKPNNVVADQPEENVVADQPVEGAPAWQVRPVPVQVRQSPVPPIVLAKNVRPKCLRFAASRSGQALLHTTGAGQDGLFRLDLATAEPLQQVPIPADKQVVAVSPDGQRLLVQSRNQSLWSVVRWTPDGVEETAPRPLGFGASSKRTLAFVDNEHVLEHHYGSPGVGLYHLPSGRKEYTVPCSGPVVVRVSPGRDYFALRRSKKSLQDPAAIDIYSTSDGRPRGHLTVPASNRVQIVDIGFSLDGTMLAALAEEGFQSRSRRLYCWDLETGELVARVAMTPALLALEVNPEREDVLWLSERFVGVFDDDRGSAILGIVDLKNQDHVWDYVTDRRRGVTREADTLELDPSGRLWLFHEEPPGGGPPALIPYALPRQEEVVQIDAAYAGSDQLASGDAVTLDVKLMTQPEDAVSAFAEKLVRETHDALREKLTAHGLRVVDQASHRFEALLSHEIGDQQLRVPVNYMKGGIIKETRYARIPNQEVVVTLRLHGSSGASRWQRTQSYVSDMVAPCEELPNAMLKDDYVRAAKLLPWVHARRWILGLELPAKFHAKRGEPVGSSQLP